MSSAAGLLYIHRARTRKDFIVTQLCTQSPHKVSGSCFADDLAVYEKHLLFYKLSIQTVGVKIISGPLTF
jgi:hypothetical protein